MSLVHLRTKCSATLRMSVEFCDDDRCNIDLLFESTSLCAVVNIRQSFNKCHIDVRQTAVMVRRSFL